MDSLGPHFLVMLAGLILSLDPAAALHAQSWTPTSAPRTNWAAVASSANGSKLVAVVSGGLVYASSDAGNTWHPTTAPLTNWSSVTSSADGTKLVAAINGQALLTPLYISTNSGLTWSPTAPLQPLPVTAVACSASGNILYALSGPIINVSLDEGATWTNLVYAFPTYLFGFSHIACSADGSKFVGSIYGLFGDELMTGPDFQWGTFVFYEHCAAVAFAADGSKSVALFNTNGIIAISTPETTRMLTNAIVTDWTSVAMSADGSTLVALATGDTIYHSTNSGQCWMTESVPYGSWISVASSADGSSLVAAVNGGGIYTWKRTPRPRLNIISSNDVLALSWIIPSEPFVLRQSANLTSTNWTDTLASPTVNTENLRDEVTIPMSGKTMYYRLESK